MKNIRAIILAAGESTRMGFPKMLLPFRGSTIVEQVIENVINSQVDGTVVVLGAGSEEIRKVIVRWPVKHCYNESYKDGMLSSIKCGLRLLPRHFEAVMVFPGDQPLIRPEIADMLISAFRATDKGIVVPAYGNRRGHPLLISGRYREALMSLDQEKGLRSLAHNYPGDVLEVETDDPDILRDIDSQEDYLNVLNK